MFEACSEIFAFIALSVGVLLISAGAAIRGVLSKPPRLRLAARVVDRPAPSIELTFLQQDRKAVTVERLELPRAVAQTLGLGPPSGFTVAPAPAPVRESSEAGQQPPSGGRADATTAEVDAQGERADGFGSALRPHPETVPFDGRLTVLRGRPAVLFLPAARLADPEGSVSAAFTYRSGFVSRRELVSAELADGRSR